MSSWRIVRVWIGPTHPKTQDMWSHRDNGISYPGPWGIQIFGLGLFGILSKILENIWKSCIVGSKGVCRSILTDILKKWGRPKAPKKYYATQGTSYFKCSLSKNRKVFICMTFGLTEIAINYRKYPKPDVSCRGCLARGHFSSPKNADLPPRSFFRGIRNSAT